MEFKDAKILVKYFKGYFRKKDSYIYFTGTKRFKILPDSKKKGGGMVFHNNLNYNNSLYFIIPDNDLYADIEKDVKIDHLPKSILILLQDKYTQSNK